MQLWIAGGKVDILVRIGVSGQGADIRVSLSDLLLEIARQLPRKSKKKVPVPLDLASLLAAAASAV